MHFVMKSLNHCQSTKAQTLHSSYLDRKPGNTFHAKYETRQDSTRCYRQQDACVTERWQKAAARSVSQRLEAGLELVRVAPLLHLEQPLCAAVGAAGGALVLGVARVGQVVDVVLLVGLALERVQRLVGERLLPPGPREELGLQDSAPSQKLVLLEGRTQSQ